MVRPLVPVNMDPSDPSLNAAGKAAAEANIEALVAFLAHGLTDERVVYQKAPFDHPQLFIPNGASDKNPQTDQMVEVPAVEFGASMPLSTFLDLDPQTP